MRMTVLGKYCPFPAPGVATSGYLIEQGDTRVLFDCGSGVLTRLLAQCPLEQLDAVVLSHLHEDHVADMQVLAYAWTISQSRGLLPPGKLRLYCPTTPRESYERLVNAGAFEITPIKPGLQVMMGRIAVSFKAMTHPVESYGMVIIGGGKRLFYTGDTNWNERIVPVAYGADMMLADAGLLDQELTEASPHLSARQCGLCAQQAGVKKLLLTHLFPGHDPQQVLSQAREGFAQAMLAEELSVYDFA